MTRPTIRSSGNAIKPRTQREIMATRRYIVRTFPDRSANSPGVIMPRLAIDLRGITCALVLPTDNPTLADVLKIAINPAERIGDGAAFDNKL